MGVFHGMSDQAWVFLGTSITELVVLLVAVIGGYVKLRLQRLEVAETRKQAERAAEQTVATGNGWAGRVEEALSAIKQGLTDNKEAVGRILSEAYDDRQVMIRHLEDHVRSPHSHPHPPDDQG